MYHTLSLCIICCVIRTTYSASTGHGNVDPSHEQPPHHSDNVTSHGNSSHGETGHHGVDHNLIVWPSAVGMLLFIFGGGFLFYIIYSRFLKAKALAEHGHHAKFFKEAVVASTVTGVAAPSLLGLEEKKLFSNSQNSLLGVTNTGLVGITTLDPEKISSVNKSSVKVTQEGPGVLGIGL